MDWLAVGILAATVVGVLAGHSRVAPPLTVAAGALTALVTGAVTAETARLALRPLAAPLAFLACSVPLAVLLDRVGFFDAAAERIALGHRLRPALWFFAAGVTTLFNLDAAVVLLTPLYLRIARRHGLDPMTTAIQPVLLASLASSALPVSNLTNLIVGEERGFGVGEFLLRLGPASLVATLVGWWCFRRLLPSGEVAGVRPAVIDPRALRIGIPVVLVLLVGFTVGEAWGVAPWMVAAPVLAALMLITGQAPVRAVPLGAGVVAAGMAVLAAAASPHLGLDGLFAGSGPGADAAAFAAGVVGADAINNLPALLVTLPHVAGTDTVFALLAGVNFGPVLWAFGSLAGLLWIDTMGRFGVEVGPIAYARVGVRVGLPALVAAGSVVLVTGWIV